MIQVALTGGIGCGKTTVCELFSRLNVPVIDTDVIARELVKIGTPALLEISQAFGQNTLLTNGELNRPLLAKKIFSHADDKHKLESILHPKIKAAIKNKTSRLSSHYVIIAIPLLFETNQQTDYDKVLVVDCNEAQQIQRTLKRDKRDLKEVQSIMRTQVKRDLRLSFADDVIDNSKKTNRLEKQVKQLHDKYMKL